MFATFLKHRNGLNPVNMNQFVSASLKDSAETLSGNGALKYSTTGDAFVDQFGKLGSYKAPRSSQEIEKDCETLWAEDKLNAIRFNLYVRMISRVPSLSGKNLSTTQRGAELRHEGIRRMMWLANKSPAAFKANLALFVAIGSWRDVFEMLKLDVIDNAWEKRKLDWNYIGGLVSAGLANEHTSELVKKWLPSLRADSKCTTPAAKADNIVAKWLCSVIVKTKSEKNSGSTYRSYRKLKSSGTAHEWQKQISRSEFGAIDFAKIHGRALNLLVRSKFLDNQGLRKSYEQWLTKPEAQEMKYTGFVHELFKGIPHSLSLLGKAEQETINRQFDALVKKGGETEATPLIVVRDTSSSMGSEAAGTGMSCFNVAKALALYFSEFLTGRFEDSFIEFNSDAKMHQWKGDSPLERWYNDKCSYVGSTNFQSVIQLLCRVKAQGVPEEEFPRGILCISDSEFNPTQLGQTNVDAARNALRKAGFSEEFAREFVIVLWNLQNSYYGRGSGSKFETYGSGVHNVFYFSGYSASTVGLLTSKIQTARELLEAALSQEAMQLATLE
jgi:hypothetical protein